MGKKTLGGTEKMVKILKTHGNFFPNLKRNSTPIDLFQHPTCS